MAPSMYPDPQVCPSVVYDEEEEGVGVVFLQRAFCKPSSPLNEVLVLLECPLSFVSSLPNLILILPYSRDALQ